MTTSKWILNELKYGAVIKVNIEASDEMTKKQATRLEGLGCEYKNGWYFITSTETHYRNMVKKLRGFDAAGFNFIRH